MCFPPLPWLTFASEPSHVFSATALATAAGKLSEEFSSKGSETYIRDFVSC